MAIEGNTLNIDQVTAIIDNKRILGPKRDILEVQNAINVYSVLDSLSSRSISSFLKAHSILLNGLVAKPGRFRTTNAGIIKGSKLAHLAPKASMVKALMNDLFNYLKNDKDHLLIRSCVFHYELEFIHPFEDGNGRMGRLWQTMILKELNPVFQYLPVESIIKQKQKEYYKALERSDRSGNSTIFIEFILSAIDNALGEHVKIPRVTLKTKERLDLFKASAGDSLFTRKDFLSFYNNISTATASRDLNWGVANQLLKMTGEKRTAQYQFR